MFLSQRATQEEYLDTPGLPVPELAESYQALGRVNRLFHFADPFQRLLVHWLGKQHVQSLAILDLGAGDGSLGQVLEHWAAEHGWNWRVTNLDINPDALRLNRKGLNVAASALCLPFRDESFDVVIASQMTHHLANETQVVRHFGEAWRVTRDALFLNDLHRNVVLLALVWVTVRVLGLPRAMQSDGFTSVRRGWRVTEWRSMAARAGIPNARVWLHLGARIMLQARKATTSPIIPSGRSASETSARCLSVA
jgi:2-polyprenyl-3-methyl-5-hydroxy-6-metoxy-1,4-benzoquinol methylase